MKAKFAIGEKVLVPTYLPVGEYVVILVKMDNTSNSNYLYHIKDFKTGFLPFIINECDLKRDVEYYRKRNLNSLLNG